MLEQYELSKTFYLGKFKTVLLSFIRPFRNMYAVYTVYTVQIHREIYIVIEVYIFSYEEVYTTFKRQPSFFWASIS